MKDDSKCPKRKWCGFDVIADLPEQQIEECRYCHKRVSYNKAEGGRTDNAKYLRDHVRDFCQPHGRTKKIFLEIHGQRHYEWFLERVNAHLTRKERKEEAIGRATKEVTDKLKFMARKGKL